MAIYTNEYVYFFLLKTLGELSVHELIMHRVYWHY